MKMLYMCLFFLDVLAISGLAYRFFQGKGNLEDDMTNNRFIYSILAAFIAGTLLLVFIQYNSSRSIAQLIEGNRLLLRDMKIGNDLREMERNILSVESKIRAAVATGDSSFVQGIDEQTAEAEASLDSLERSDLDSGSRADIERLSVLTRDRVNRKNILLDSFFRTGKMPPPRLIANTRLRGTANEINAIMRRLYERRKDRLAAVSASVTKYGRIARTSGIVLITFVLLSGSGLFWFIIDRMRRQNELIRRLDASERQLQDAVRVKENFLANMSHEIRTPLNSIIGFTGLLARKSLDADSREFVTAIGESGENLLAIVNDILDLSKIEAGMMRVDARPFSVRELFHSVEMLFQQRMKEKGLGLRMVMAEGVPELLSGDATRLTQILVNLIGNAVKFTERGDVEVRVSSRGTGDAVQLWTEVKDTGIGISREQMAVIFDRFSQAEGSITRKYGGTGLGLAIVKELIELQHGEIEVESELEKGTCFRFYIPYAVVDAMPGRLVDSAPDMPRMKGVRVLVADDNRTNQRLMEHLLRGAGIVFDVVEDGLAVLARLREREYDLVLMDIQMPGMDGYTASRAIREELKSPVPIVAMTAHAMPGEREKCLAAGMNEYLPKPIDSVELFKVIGRFVRSEEVRGPEEQEKFAGPEGGKPVAREAMVGIGPGEATAYRFIDVTYLRELSGGDREYEVEMADQFLAALPEELGLLGSALAAGDKALAGRVAHTMKTTVSIMGMSERLYVLLDSLEYPDGISDLFAVFATLRQVCEVAMEEAGRFAR